MRRVSARLIVGRGPEMEALSQAAARTLAGQPSVVLVLGEPGIGKSRLVADWSAGQKAHGWVALTGRCVELAGPVLPLAAVGDALRDLLRQVGEDRVGDLAGRWRDALAPLLPELSTDGAPSHDLDRSSLFEGVAFLLSRLAAEQPVVLVIEDLHWADASTRDLVSYLLHTATDERVLLVLTLRDEANPAQPLERFLAELLRQPAVEQLTLGRLSRDEVAAQVKDITGQPAPPGRLARLADLSDGIPFLVEELLADPAGHEVEPSDRVRRIVLARLLGLSSQTRRLVEAASLAEAELSDRLLRTVLAETDIDVDEALHAAVAAAVLVAGPEEERLRFRHALLRLAVAESLLPGERRNWHLRWAMAIEVSPEPPDALPKQVALAHHWDAAGEAARALPAALRAADTCRRQGAFTEQSVLLRRALELWDQVADAEALTGLTRNRLVDDTHDALDAALDHQASETMLDAELTRPEVAADPLRHLLVRLHLSGSLSWQGRPDDMDLPEWEPTIRLARRAAPSRDKTKVLRELCWWANWTDPATARTLIEDAVRAAEAIGDEQLLLAARVDRANQRCFLGGHEESFREYAELRLHLARMDPASAAMAQYFLVILPLALGRLEQAAVEAETARARLGSAAAAPAAWTRIAWPYAETLLGLGRWAAARQVLDEARTLPVLAHDPADRLYLDSGRGLLAVWQGDLDMATALAEIAVPAGGETPASIWDGPMWLRAEVALAAGDAERAREILQPAWTKPDLIAHADVVRRLLAVAARAEAEICLTARRDVSTLRASADMVRTLRHVAAQLPPCSPLEGAAELQFEAELARRAGEPTLARWQAAEAAWGRMGFPHERGWTLLRLAESHLQVGASHGRCPATAALRTAAEIAERLAARPLGTEVAALARRARLDLQAAEAASAPDRRSGGDRVSTRQAIAGTLTEREAEVLELMIDGQTNREIARRLYMSPKTASVHVSRIIMKFGAANRTQAATIGYRLRSGRGN